MELKTWCVEVMVEHLKRAYRQEKLERSLARRQLREL
jgi:hypothetical protein